MREYTVKSKTKPFSRVECPLMRSYITGLLDTRLKFIIWDGRKNGKGWTCRATFTTTDPREIEFLNDKFHSGVINEKQSKRPDNWRKTSSHAKVFCCAWSAGGLLLDHIIEIMEQHAIFSADFLGVMKEFRYLTRDAPRLSGGMTPPHINQQRDEVHARFLSLDRKYLKNKNPKRDTV